MGKLASQVLFLALFFLLTNGQVKVETKGNKMTFTPPTLSQEDQFEIHMPDYLKCDACLAITYSLDQVFAKKQRNNRLLSESEVIHILGKKSNIEAYALYLPSVYDVCNVLQKAGKTHTGLFYPFFKKERFGIMRQKGRKKTTVYSRASGLDFDLQNCQKSNKTSRIFFRHV